MRRRVLPSVRFMTALGRITQELLRCVSAVMNHVGANCRGALFITKASPEVEHGSFNAFMYIVILEIKSY